jgi:hypothetical protein
MEVHLSNELRYAGDASAVPADEVRSVYNFIDIGILSDNSLG